MRKTVTLLAAVLCVLVMAPRADAQLVIVPHAGYDFDVESLFFGVGIDLPLQLGDLPVPLSARPSVEYYLGDSTELFGVTVSTSILQINGDVLATFIPPADGIGVYGGAGLAVSIISVSVSGGGMSGESESETEIGLNLFGGAQFGDGDIAPFAEARLSTPGTTRFQIKGGVRIAL